MSSNVVQTSPQPQSRPVLVLGLGQSMDEIAPARELMIRQADVLVAAERIQRTFPGFSGRRITLKAPLRLVLDELARHAGNGLQVVVLVGGDPCFYGIGPLLVRRLGPERVRLFPGTTTVQAAAALLGISWQDIAVVSLHGRENTALLFAALARNQRVAVYTDERNTPATLARMVLERGGENFAVHVFENLGLVDERTGRFTLDEVRNMDFSSLNLVLFERTQEPAVRLSLGMPEADYVHEQGLITKRWVRSAALAALDLEGDDLLWDLGAGCGSVGIEAGLLLPRGSVLAVERAPRRVAMIRENIRRTNAFWVHVVAGDMPDCLHALPAPDRIFIGGGLSRNTKLLDTACVRLKPGGRLVAAVVLLESLDRLRQHFEQLGWPLEIIHLQTAQSIPLAGGTRLSGQNPVFLACTRKPEPGTP